MQVTNHVVPKKRKTRNYTFRIDEELLDILFEEAKTQGINANALMNKVLEQYRVHGRNLKRFGVVSMSRNIFSKIINCCTEDELKEIAKTVGSTEITDMLRAHGIRTEYNTVIEYVKSYGSIAGWFNSINHIEDTRNYMHLRHELGEKWSTFLAEAATTMFKTLLDIEVETEQFETSVTIKLPN